MPSLEADESKGQATQSFKNIISLDLLLRAQLLINADKCRNRPPEVVKVDLEGPNASVTEFKSHELRKSRVGTLMKKWCRRWESNLRPTLKARKLFILHNATNAESARSPIRGYAAVTRGNRSTRQY